jgi:hypothetical protein
LHPNDSLAPFCRSKPGTSSCKHFDHRVRAQNLYLHCETHLGPAALSLVACL